MSFGSRALPTFAMLLIHVAVACPPPSRPDGVEESLQTLRVSQRKTIEPVDINRASAEDFARLPGIGPELARRIVAFREKHGPFRRVEDLLVIRGVGHKKWRGIRGYLRVGEEAREKKR